MAYTINNPKVGQYVYKGFRPLNPGIIRTIDGKDFGGHFDCVHVQWLSGLITAETTNGLNDFDALIADHRKKLNTHEANHQRLINLDVKWHFKGEA